MFAGLDIIALAVVDLLKGRLRMVLLAAALVPVVVAALLLINEGPFAEAAPAWLAFIVAFAPLMALYATLIVPAVRLAKPTSRWARRFYDEAKLARARERFSS